MNDEFEAPQGLPSFGCSPVLPVPGPGFRARFWAGFGRQAGARGQGGLGPDEGPFAWALRLKPAQNLRRKPGRGTLAT